MIRLANASPSMSGGGYNSLSLRISLQVMRNGWSALPGGMMIRMPEWRQPRMAPPRASTMNDTRKLQTGAKVRGIVAGGRAGGGGKGGGETTSTTAWGVNTEGHGGDARSREETRDEKWELGSRLDYGHTMERYGRKWQEIGMYGRR